MQPAWCWVSPQGADGTYGTGVIEGQDRTYGTGRQMWGVDSCRWERQGQGLGTEDVGVVRFQGRRMLAYELEVKEMNGKLRAGADVEAEGGESKIED